MNAAFPNLKFSWSGRLPANARITKDLITAAGIVFRRRCADAVTDTFTHTGAGTEAL